MPKLIFDPLHGFVELSSLCLKIVDTPIFQRLRKLKQLGVVYYVFPSANHTRFEHSIGVAFLAKKMLSTIQSKQPELNITSDHLMCVEIAGLCHDLGHGPWSHLFDDFLKEVVTEKDDIDLLDHENRSCYLFQYLVEKEKLPLSPIHVKWICDMIQPPRRDQDRTLPAFYYQIVANKQNGIDVDKFDYLLRDTFFLGFPQKFDYQRIFQQARVINSQICYSEKSCFEIYDLFLTRYRMHVQVYRHPVVQAFELMHLQMLSHIVKSRQEWLSMLKYPHEFNKYCHDGIFLMLHNWDGDNPNHVFSRRIEERQHYKFLGEFINPRQNTRDLLKTRFHDLVSHILIKEVTLGYKEDPVQKVLFYDHQDPDKSFYLQSNKISQLLPTNFQETRTRWWYTGVDQNMYKKCKDAFEKIKSVI